MFSSNIYTVGGTQDAPDYLYYNAEIVNNETNDQTENAPIVDPQVRFNETRDTALVRDASQYHFSIVRFTMNGPSLDLPLFIPIIQTGQPNVNKTTYEMAVSIEQTYSFGTITVTPPVRAIIYVPETKSVYSAPVPRNDASGLVGNQDISTRYYWVYTIQHWVDLWNQTMLDPAQLGLAYNDPTPSTCCATDSYRAFYTQWNALGGGAFPYATLSDFLADLGRTPFLSYNPSTQRFSLYADTRVFGEEIPVTTPVSPALTKPTFRLWFDTNMQGLFSNFSNLYWNTQSIATSVPHPFPNTPAPSGYVTEILFPNKLYTNILDYKTTAPAYVPVAEQLYYWIEEQDWLSTSQLWSPISSIVFTSTLLGVRSEQTGPPNVLGSGDLGYSASVAQSAFQPIITDIAPDLSTYGADTYKRFLYYAPTAEYRLSDFGPSKQEIRNIDVQVYWKCRLDSQLYPIQMFNLSSVSLKVMFRHKMAIGGK